MTTIEKPREAELNVTGYCKHRNHKKCPYRAGGATENGIARRRVVHVRRVEKGVDR